MLMTRSWCMPSPDTFNMPPAAQILDRVLSNREIVVDPFARNSGRGTITNDLDPDSLAQYHMDAPEFMEMLFGELGEAWADAIILDPPYSPRQMSEAYKSVGLKKGMAGSQNARLYKECKDIGARILKVGGVAITAGWNSMGFGINRGFRLDEVHLIACGAAHNDYIITVETKQ